MRLLAFFLLGAAAAACSGSSGSGNTTSTGGSDSGTNGGSDSGTTGGDASSSGGGDSGSTTDGGGPTGDAGSGSGSVNGSPDGNPFGNVAASYWIGSPDSPTTTVVYLFSNPIKCSELASPGWDGRITTGTRVIEMKMFGTTPATYNVTTSMTPAPGEASVNFVVTAATPTETVASGGTVTLTKVNANTDASGSFALKWGNNSINGTYDAVYCAGGHEP